MILPLEKFSTEFKLNECIFLYTIPIIIHLDRTYNNVGILQAQWKTNTTENDRRIEAIK